MSRLQLTWDDTLAPVQLSQVRTLLGAAAAADGVEPVGEQVVRSLTRPAARTPHLLAQLDGGVLGYAHLDAPDLDGPDLDAPHPPAPPFAELVVHPDCRRAGVGAALLAGVRSVGGVDTRVWAHGDLAPARALAASAGLVVVRELWQLRLDLESVPLPELAERADVRLRTYVAGPDDAAVLAVNNAAFAWHPEQGGWTGGELAERRAESWFDAGGFFLATDAGTGELLGFHWTKVHPAEGGQPALGEVYVLGVSPAAQGRGLGQLLTLAGLHHLRAAGVRTVLLYVEGNNTAAGHTYGRLGFTRFHVDRVYGAR